MFRVYARKTFEFENSDGEKKRVKHASFESVPDWVKKTPLFELALKDESIVVINDKEDEKKVELAPDPKSQDTGKPEKPKPEDSKPVEPPANDKTK